MSGSFDKLVAEKWINEIRNGKFDTWTDRDKEDGIFEKCVAVLEYPWLDIELNLSSDADSEGNDYVNRIVPSYFCCVRGMDTEDDEPTWVEGGYLDDIGYYVEVDWNADDWLDQLKADMERVITQAAKDLNLKLDEPNWYGDPGKYFFMLATNGR